MTVSGRGRIDRARSRPTITARIVSSARVQIGFAVATESSPDNHFRTCPDCRVTVSALGRVGGVSGYPTVRARIVSATGVEKVVVITVILIKGPAPDNHFSAAPHCGVRNARLMEFTVLVPGAEACVLTRRRGPKCRASGQPPSSSFARQQSRRIREARNVFTRPTRLLLCIIGRGVVLDLRETSAGVRFY